MGKFPFPAKGGKGDPKAGDFPPSKPSKGKDKGKKGKKGKGFVPFQKGK